ncbi:hypothetical protein NC653_018713 [Populus alba x Populus x berolinensis]|uniref:Uncharacterized protein n=1 Tax=Populus alba x Populus x berolinensis TaxID=444605 RepID=A0AAD6QH10_9ROSI|nr:hypothetical protein NC653_018713 [Populus alba x Populus x berolinensis]
MIGPRLLFLQLILIVYFIDSLLSRTRRKFSRNLVILHISSNASVTVTVEENNERLYNLLLKYAQGGSLSHKLRSLVVGL